MAATLLADVVNCLRAASRAFAHQAKASSNLPKTCGEICVGPLICKFRAPAPFEALGKDMDKAGVVALPKICKVGAGALACVSSPISAGHHRRTYTDDGKNGKEDKQVMITENQRVFSNELPKVGLKLSTNKAMDCTAASLASTVDSALTWLAASLARVIFTVFQT